MIQQFNIINFNYKYIRNNLFKIEILIEYSGRIYKLIRNIYIENNSEIYITFKFSKEFNIKIENIYNSLNQFNYNVIPYIKIIRIDNILSITNYNNSNMNLTCSVNTNNNNNNNNIDLSLFYNNISYINSSIDNIANNLNNYIIINNQEHQQFNIQLNSINNNLNSINNYITLNNQEHERFNIQLNSMNDNINILTNTITNVNQNLNTFINNNNSEHNIINTQINNLNTSVNSIVLNLDNLNTFVTNLNQSLNNFIATNNQEHQTINNNINNLNSSINNIITNFNNLVATNTQEHNTFTNQITNLNTSINQIISNINTLAETNNQDHILFNNSINTLNTSITNIISNINTIQQQLNSISYNNNQNQSFNYANYYVSNIEPANPRIGDLYYNLTNDNLFQYINNTWIEIPWRLIIINTPEYERGNLRINNNKLEISPNGTNWYQCYPLIGANVLNIKTINNINYSYLYYLPPQGSAIIENANHLPIVYVKDVIPIFNLHMLWRYSYEYWIGLRPNGIAISNGDGQQTYGNSSSTTSSRTTGLSFVPIFEQSNTTENYGYSSIFIDYNQRILTLSHNHGSAGYFNTTSRGSGTASANSYWLGIWYSQANVQISIEYLTIKRLR